TGGDAAQAVTLLHQVVRLAVDRLYRPAWERDGQPPAGTDHASLRKALTIRLVASYIGRNQARVLGTGAVEALRNGPERVARPHGVLYNPPRVVGLWRRGVRR